MDNKQFTNAFAERCKLSIDQTSDFVSHLTSIMRERLCNQDSVAIPAFGTFATNKTDEYIAVDQSTGARMLFPPKINIEFTPGAMLKKNIRNER